MRIKKTARGVVLGQGPTYTRDVDGVLTQELKKAHKGFTLVEILVVVLIIGLTLGFALLNFGDFGGKRRIIVAAEQFAHHIKAVQQQAILETSTLGIHISQAGYQTLRFEPSRHRWLPVSSHRLFQQQLFPDNLILAIKHSVHKKGQPEIIINATGDITPFTLELGTGKQPSLITLHAEPSGTVTVNHHE
jgi:general secretion pathway protein H